MFLRIFKKPKWNRLFYISAALISAMIGLGLLLYSFQNNLVFFYTPSQLASNPQAAARIAEGKTIRLGGMVEKGTLVKFPDAVTIEFIVTDYLDNVKVRYRGIVPALFAENQGVVAEGVLRDGIFEASQILAKHDENYMPPEVAQQLKASGKWDEVVKRKDFPFKH